MKNQPPLLSDQRYADDGRPTVKPRDPHYSDKGGHGARHDITQQERHIERQARRAQSKNR